MSLKDKTNKLNDKETEKVNGGVGSSSNSADNSSYVGVCKACKGFNNYETEPYNEREAAKQAVEEHIRYKHSDLAELITIEKLYKII